MAGFGHGPAIPAETEDPAIAARNARYGMVLFVIYLVIYGGFVVLNAFAPHIMEREAMSGLNLAVVYGFALIVAALMLALLYCWMCRPVTTLPVTSTPHANGATNTPANGGRS